MFMRSTVLASAAAMAAAMFSTAAADTNAERCDGANLRIYFAQDDAALTPEALEILRAAEQRVAQCDYAELRVVLDETAPHARERGDAILAAADGRVWNAARVERRDGVSAASGAPDYAEVVMSPRALPLGEALPAERSTGV